jgi:peroxiredoxin
MTRMRKLLLLLWFTLPALSLGQVPQPSEENFRKRLGMSPSARLQYRDTQCRPVDFAGFVEGMHQPNAHADVDRAVDGSAVTMTVKLKGMAACPSPYPPITEMPPFALHDLSGKRVTSQSLRGKPTLISFFFATCVPCILEVQPINKYRSTHPEMNFLAVTFDSSSEAQAFVQRHGLEWRVLPDAQDLVERMRVKQFPLMALFDARGKLLGTRKGGVRDPLEAAAVEPQLRRWVESLLRQ